MENGFDQEAKNMETLEVTKQHQLQGQFSTTNTGQIYEGPDAPYKTNYLRGHLM